MNLDFSGGTRSNLKRNALKTEACLIYVDGCNE